MENKKGFDKQQQGKVDQEQNQHQQAPKNLEPQGDQKGAQQISESDKENIRR